MIYFRTFAYNAEKTLERTICSILNQTYTEYTYYLMDNGSTDRTRDIIKKYARIDSRIVPFYADKNHDHTQNLSFWNLPHNLNEDDFFCILDADDYYAPTFLEEMIPFLKEKKLDIAICGCGFFDGATGKFLENRVLPDSIILENEESFEQYFPAAHWYLRAVWGKVYTAKAARARYETSMPEWFPKAYGGDTVNVYECVKASERIGIYAKVLHYYAISTKSVSYKWIEGREKADVILLEKAFELLEQKCKKVSLRNQIFLYKVYFSAISDTFKVLFNADLAVGKKLEIARMILLHQHTKKMLLIDTISSNEEKKNFLQFVVGKLVELSGDLSETDVKNLYLILKFVNADITKWVTEEQLKWYFVNCPTVLYHLTFVNEQQAVNHLLVYLVSVKDWGKIDKFPILMGQNLSALLEEENKYIFFSKKMIFWYIANGFYVEAQQELQEWTQMLPEDEEIKMLCAVLGNKR